MNLILKGRSFLILAILCFTGASFSVLAQDDFGAAIQWRRWEHRFTIDEAEEKIPEVKVIFSGPGGREIKSVAFSDDGRTFILRMAFPEVGEWRWRAGADESRSRKLHHYRGKVAVMRYIGDNPLYAHGDLRISPDKRYLVHADGTPFLWIGDTGWGASLKSDLHEWKQYIDTRASQGFNVIQISPRGVGNRNTASENNDISFDTDGRPDTLFWKDLESKITYANDKGLMILMVGTGSAWRDRMARNPFNQKFESYISGRMASSMVMFSPSFDQLFVDELDKVAFELKKYTQHLVTQHPGTNYRANITYRNSNSVDFGGLQSGHHNGDVMKAYDAARQWTIDMWFGAPVKPVINIETMYDAYGTDDARNWRRKDSRKLGWITWLAGARGYTYGAGDVPPKVPLGSGAVWRFNRDSSKYDYWENAINWQSARQMSFMKAFLNSTEWWKFIPAMELIRNQAQVDTLMMVASRTVDLDAVMVYAPDNPSVVLDMAVFYGTYRSSWFNPQTGEYSKTGVFSGGDPNRVFNRPEGWEDAVLKIVRD